MFKLAVFVHLILFISTGYSQELPSGRNWSQILPELVKSNSLIFLGEHHGNLANLENYQAIFKQDSIDTIFLEWIYDHKQPILDAYLNDKRVTPHSLKEAYYHCLLTRNNLFDVGAKTPPLTYESFHKLFADVSPAKLISACDMNDRATDFLRTLHHQRLSGKEVKICAIDYWDYYGSDLTIPRERFASFSPELLALVNEFFAAEEMHEVVREMAMGENIAKCVSGRKKAIGIVGAFHLNSSGAAQIAQRLLGKSTKALKIVQVTSAQSDDGEVCEGEDYCVFANESIQKRLSGLKAPLSVSSPDWIKHFSTEFEFDPELKSFLLGIDYILVQSPQGRIKPSRETIGLINGRLKGIWP